MLIYTQDGKIVNMGNFSTVWFEIEAEETIDMYAVIKADEVTLGTFTVTIEDWEKERVYNDDDAREAIFRCMRKDLRDGAREEVKRIYKELKNNGGCEITKSIFPRRNQCF